jgi:hypothetical protein
MIHLHARNWRLWQCDYSSIMDGDLAIGFACNNLSSKHLVTFFVRFKQMEMEIYNVLE